MLPHYQNQIKALEENKTNANAKILTIFQETEPSNGTKRTLHLGKVEFFPGLQSRFKFLKINQCNLSYSEKKNHDYLFKNFFYF